MNMCPQCKEEFLEHISWCRSCDKELVKSHEEVAIKNISKQELLKEEMLALNEGSLEQCREIEKILGKAQIPVIVYPAQLGCDDHTKASLGSSCAAKYLVLISPSDLERCRGALEGHFHAQVSREGQGSFVPDIVDISQSEVLCPACSEKGPLNNGECSFCGLFLGEH